MFKRLQSYFIADALAATDDIFVQAQIKLTFQLILIWTGMLGLLVASYAPLPVNWHFIYVHYFFLAWIVAALPVLKITKSYKAAGAFVVFTLAGVTTFMLFYFKGMQSAETSMWYMFITIISFILLGKRWGWIIGVYFLLLMIIGLLNTNNDWQLFDVGLEVGYDLESDPVSHAIPMLLGLYSLSHFLATRSQAQSIISEQKEKVEAVHKDITDSIIYAKRIQNALMPPVAQFKEYLPDSFILYKPKDVVAGDFYWLEHVDNKILFAACDCTGHGVPGAMVSVICNNALTKCVQELGLTEPGQILDKTREMVIKEFQKGAEDVHDGMDAAICALEGTKLKYAGAHNPLWIIRNGSDEIEEIKADKQPVGKYMSSEPFTTHEVELSNGDLLYVFSDGYADQFGGENGKKFKTGNFKKLLLSIRSESMGKQRELIDQRFEEWMGDIEQIDDVCVIGVRV
ncbi:MAG: SpoIIE family protein phosphatase [Flavobacteriales bacterium]